MTIKDIIKCSATVLGRENVINYLESQSQSTEDTVTLTEINTLCRCTNLVINELAMTYFPMEKTEEITLENGEFFFSDFTENAVRITNVKDVNGGKVNYKLYPDKIQSDINVLTVTYQYLPSNLGLTDTVNYSERKVPVRVIAYGVSAEFNVTARNFSDAVFFHEKYMNALSDLVKPKNANVKKRRFV